MNDDSSYLTCSSCKKHQKVVDSGNDAEHPQNSKDLISTLVSQKCKACDKFNCLDCLGDTC